MNNELDLRYIPPVATIVTMKFNNLDGTTLTKVSPGDITILTDNE